MDAGALNQLLINFALLISSCFAISLTYRHPQLPDGPARILLRYSLTVGTAFMLIHNSVHIGAGLLFDLRSVPVALAARRNGLLPGLLVALPIALYRLSLGGPGAPAGVLSLLLVALLAALPTGTLP